MSDDTPLISVVIASYQDCDLLSRSLESFLRHNVDFVELIVVDGASSDGTLELLRSHSDVLSTWLSEPDVGIYDAWNKGLALASGTWIAFLGAGDIYLPGALNMFRDFVTASPEFDYISTRVSLRTSSGGTRVIGEAWSWPLFSQYMTVAHVGSFHNRRLFERYGLFNISLKICGDYEFLLRPLGSLRASFLDSVLVQMEPGGISNSSFNCLLETYRVKTDKQIGSKFQLMNDFLVAVLKWYGRRFLSLIRYY